MDTLTIPDLLAARADAEPLREAMRVAGGSAGLTFGAWQLRTDRVTRGLLDHGVDRGDRIGLRFRSTHWPEFAVAYCAVQKAGAVAVPLAATGTAAEVTHALASCGARLTIGDASSVDASASPYLPFADLDGGADGGPVASRARPGDLGQILYTSGTTGKPKGIGATHDNLTFGTALQPRRRAFAHSKHFVHAFPIGTTAAQAMLVNALVLHPTALVLPRFDPEAFCATIEDLGVGTAFLVPAMAIDLLSSRAYERYDMSSLMVLSSTGSTLPPPVAQSLVRAFPDATVFNSYSSTEALPAQVLVMIDPDRPDSLGMPVGATRISIRDQGGTELPAGETGEVWLRCPTTPRMYYDDPDATAETFRDGWVRMGDIGQLDEEGNLYLVDREGDVIQAGGIRISTTEVETALLGHPGVREAAVVGLAHPVMGTMVAAAVVTDGGIPLREVRVFLRDRVAPHKVPVRWLTLDALPRNAMGKVVKGELRPLFGATTATAEPRPDPADGASGTVVPLSAQQEAFLGWMTGTGGLRSPVPVTVAVRVADKLDEELLRRSLAALEQRHEALRTVFPEHEGRRRAVVRDALEPEVRRLTATGADPRSRLADARELLCRERDRPFDLAHGPLLRAATVELGAADRVFLVAVHHLVCDAWSMGVLLRELGLVYSALRTGGAEQLRGPAPMQSCEVVRHSRGRWPATVPQWQELLAGAPPDLASFPGRRPTDLLHPRSLPFRIDDGLADAVRRRARAGNATPFVVVLAAWASVLSSWTAATDLVVMSPVSGRTTPGSESALGCLFSSLLVRLDLRGQPEFAELLGRVRAATARSLELQDYPYAEFQRRFTHAPCVGYYRWDVPLHLPGLESAEFALPLPLVDDLEVPGRNRGVPQLVVVERPDGSMAGRLAFNDAAFELSTVEQLAEDLVHFLGRVVEE
jgi:acyl-coenzyme A synthetase/AMP-(fatty) acid ligase